MTMTTEIDIAQLLADAGVVYTDSHFEFTGGAHSPSYVNCREFLHMPPTKRELGRRLVAPFLGSIDVVVGPETGGRSLAEAAAAYSCEAGCPVQDAWVKVEDDPSDSTKKVITWDEKLGFADVICGKRVLVVDDLLTKGTTLKAVIEFLRKHGAIVYGVAVIVRREADVNASALGVEGLHVLYDPEGLISYDVPNGESCPLCEAEVPIVIDLAHGKRFIASHPGYPTTTVKS